MYKTYAVVFQNQRTGRVLVDMFPGSNEGEARRNFRECYRHDNYRILSTVEAPDIETE